MGSTRAAGFHQADLTPPLAEILSPPSLFLIPPLCSAVPGRLCWRRSWHGGDPTGRRLFGQIRTGTEEAPHDDTAGTCAAALLTCGLATANDGTHAAPVDPGATEADLKLLQIEKNIVAYTNEQRRRRGLAPLVIDLGLVRSARQHAIWMARTGRCNTRGNRSPRTSRWDNRRVRRWSGRG